MAEIKNLKVSQLEVNKGQIEGLPKNPRFIKDDRYKALKKSIEDAPEMLSLRELIVYPHGDKFVVIGGNMRLRACTEIGYKEIPCKVLPAETPAEKLREYAIKDNVGFGSDDFDILANEWDIDELTDWGMELDFGEECVDEDGFGDEFKLPEGEKSPFQQMTFTLADEQAEKIKEAIDEAKKTDSFKYVETFGNENGNGNAIYQIVMQWIESRK